MTLGEYLAQIETSRASGEWSEWLDFAELALVSGKLFVGDPQRYPDGVTAMLPPGRYPVQVRLYFDGDGGWVCARLRVIRMEMMEMEGGTLGLELGSELGKIKVDFGSVGVADQGLMQAAVRQLPVEEYNRMTREIGMYGILPWNPAIHALMPYVRSGYGNGSYSVHALLKGGVSVGMEADFLTGLGLDE